MSGARGPPIHWVPAASALPSAATLSTSPLWPAPGFRRPSKLRLIDCLAGFPNSDQSLVPKQPGADHPSARPPSTHACDHPTGAAPVLRICTRAPACLCTAACLLTSLARPPSLWWAQWYPSRWWLPPSPAERQGSHHPHAFPLGPPCHQASSIKHHASCIMSTQESRGPGRGASAW